MKGKVTLMEVARVIEMFMGVTMVSVLMGVTVRVRV
jgi:hypothetical protein